VSGYIVPKGEVMTVGDNWSRTAAKWIVNFEEGWMERERDGEGFNARVGGRNV
jgi:hypothetical protein